LAHPGANATGVSTLSIELIPKRLELLRQVAPRVRRVILLGNPNGSYHAQVLKHAQKGASALQMQLIAMDARDAGELDAALLGIQRGTADALMASPDVLFLSNKSKIAQAVAKARMPAIFPWPDNPEAGVLMAYGASTQEMGLLAASYVDRILKGAKPADLPIEQISKYELVINLRVARDLGLKVPQEVLLRADNVIR
jgi:putative ABC transport system substrate-binding protein